MRVFPLLSLIASIAPVLAGFDKCSTSNVVLYWGQNSLNKANSQDRLVTYCENPDVDILTLAFMVQMNGTGGQPVLNFANQGNNCMLFNGTELFYCPQLETDIQSCQNEYNKTIMLSIGGATYSEGGFATAALARQQADKIWRMFGPPIAGDSTPRPFGSAVVDGFDLDLESKTQNFASFGGELRSIMNQYNRSFFLSSAPQCPFPDLYNADVLRNVSLDFVCPQFYNNYCGVNTFVGGANTTQPDFNLDVWDQWAANFSMNPDVRIMVGVPGNVGAAQTGYVPPAELSAVFEYSQQFCSFGGSMIWDASQAFANEGFLSDVKAAL